MGCSLTCLIDLSPLGAKPPMCTMAADESIIRKGGQSRSASFATSKGPSGGIHNTDRALKYLVISSVVIIYFSISFLLVKIMAITSRYKSLESKSNLNFLDLMLPQFHELWQHKAMRVSHINNTACGHKIALLFAWKDIKIPFNMSKKVAGRDFVQRYLQSMSDTGLWL